MHCAAGKGGKGKGKGKGQLPDVGSISNTSVSSGIKLENVRPEPLPS